MSVRRLAILAGCAWALSHATTPVSAFERARTGAPWSQPLSWRVNPVPFVLDAAGSKDLAPAAAHAAIRLAFAAWESVPCAYIAFRDDGVRANQGLDYRAGQPNVNAVHWLESNWIRDRGAIAYTTITAVERTGEIIDADISLNGVSFAFSAENGPVAGKVDVQQVVTHEVGHLLGLDHSTVPGATMRANLGTGEITARELGQDDIDGVCAIYPLGSEPKPPAAQGCAAGGESPVGFLGALLALALLACGRRRFVTLLRQRTGRRWDARLFIGHCLKTQTYRSTTRPERPDARRPGKGAP